MRFRKHANKNRSYDCSENYSWEIEEVSRPKNAPLFTVMLSPVAIVCVIASALPLYVEGGVGESMQNPPSERL